MKKEIKYTIWGGVGVFFLLAIFKRKSIMHTLFDKQKLITTALQEYKHWNNGAKKENTPEMIDKLKEYWNAAGIKSWSDEKMRNEAWSAAFISYLMKKANAGTNFKYSPSHSVFIREAIKNKKEESDNPFKAYKPSEVKLNVGDIIAYPRQSGVNYDTITDYASHSDVVVQIKNGIAKTIGGNVANTVSATSVYLTKDGKIDTERNKKKYFVVIKSDN